MNNDIHYYKSHINKLGNRFGERNLYNEITQAIESNEALALMHHEVGIVVIKPVHRGGEFTMLIWLAIGFCRNAFAKYLPVIEDMARQQKVSKIEFETKRKGFKRFAAKFNFNEVRQRDEYTIFSKEVF